MQVTPPINPSQIKINASSEIFKTGYSVRIPLRISYLRDSNFPVNGMPFPGWDDIVINPASGFSTCRLNQAPMTCRTETNYILLPASVYPLNHPLHTVEVCEVR